MLLCFMAVQNEIIDRVFREDVRLDSSGQPVFLRQVENVKSAIENRLGTWKGRVLHHPQYGGILKKYTGALINADLLNAIEKEVRTQILRDPRVESVSNFSLEYNQEGRILIKVSIELVSISLTTDLSLVI